MLYKILLVDDEEDIIKLLKDYFQLQGYLVYTALNGNQALENIEKDPDIILLDINMPDIDGLEVCKRIREHVTCPILFLTAKVEEKDRINGLMIGGDDYILKPFSIDELGARVIAHLRRQGRNTSREELKFTEEMVINYSQRCVYIKEKEINLTKKEFDIVELLSLGRGQIFSKEDIYEKLWGYDGNGDSSIIMEHVRRIRQKLGKYKDNSYIETVWGIGYKWIG